MFGSSKNTPVCRGLQVPIEADSVAGPTISYGDNPVAINFLARDGSWGRVTFERFDSIRVSRGEYSPYPDARGKWKEGDAFFWVSIVDHSPWLQERYAYEKAHYGENYNFGGDVDEMQAEFSHYLFEFHDEYVEALAAGIWFEQSSEVIGTAEPGPDHPLAELPESAVTNRFEAHGITCQVRTNPKDRDTLARDAAALVVPLCGCPLPSGSFA